MTEPIIERILQNVKTVVDGITVVAGYNQDLDAVRPTKMDFDDGAPAVNGKVVILCDDPEPNVEKSNAGNPARQAWTLSLVLVAYVIPSDTSTTPIDTLINRVRADIEKALQADPYRGELAVDTSPAGSQKFVEEGGAACGVAVFVDVVYRTPINDPYTAAG
jgi:hypothetical protein